MLRVKVRFKVSPSSQTREDLTDVSFEEKWPLDIHTLAPIQPTLLCNLTGDQQAEKPPTKLQPTDYVNGFRH